VSSLQPVGLASTTVPITKPPRRLDKAAELQAFRKHADETNDIFHLAAQVVAKVLLQADRLLFDGSLSGTLP
jgi:hypothetical protein